MAQIPLLDLVVSVISDNRQALNAAKEVEAAYEKALKGGDTSGLQRSLEQLAKAATEANRRLDLLAGQAHATAQEMQSLAHDSNSSNVSGVIRNEPDDEDDDPRRNVEVAGRWGRSEAEQPRQQDEQNRNDKLDHAVKPEGNGFDKPKGERRDERQHEMDGG